MDLVLEMYNDGRYLSNDAQTLRQERERERVKVEEVFWSPCQSQF